MNKKTSFLHGIFGQKSQPDKDVAKTTDIQSSNMLDSVQPAEAADVSNENSDITNHGSMNSIHSLSNPFESTNHESLKIKGIYVSNY